ncbi:hypothetical protein AMTR_s00157p00058420 [Amborella trichopoda]|uniref:Peptidase M20 dimerisation domain-containing protein n=1 Tax=Amborella trichopoda TaxID=13333 RepID=W1PIX5_AMBTC|nr:hypothetical protein AMTR_s00157p00058420 [Amborella trichopoda]
MEVVRGFREAQFDMVRAELSVESEVVSVSPVYVKAGTRTPTGFVMNMQPSEAEAGYDVRLPPTADAEVLKWRVANEWAPATRNMTYEIIEKGPLRDINGRPLMTATNESNPWWLVLRQAILSTGGILSKPEILGSTTDTRFMRKMDIPALGFSPVINTPRLLHAHDEFLNEDMYMKGIEVYETVISSLSSFTGDLSS